VQEIPTEAVAELDQTREASFETAEQAEPALAIEQPSTQPRLWPQFVLWVAELSLLGWLGLCVGNGLSKAENQP
jgi:hypothetical protein